MGRPEKRLPPAVTEEEQFGAELRYWRERRGMSAAELGAAVGRDRRTIYGIEHATDASSAALIERLEGVLDSGGILISRYEAVVAARARRGSRPRAAGGTLSPHASGADASVFVGETIPDGTLMAPGERFVKTWTLRNAGTVAWRGRYVQRIGAASGIGLITTPSRVAVPSTDPGSDVVLEVPCVAHRVEGTSSATFKMVDADGLLLFGDRYTVGLMVQVTVVSEAQLREIFGGKSATVADA